MVGEFQEALGGPGFLVGGGERVDDGVWLGLAMRLGKEPGARYGTAAGAQVEDSRSQVLSSVDFAVDSEDLLRGGDRDVVEARAAMVSEAGADVRSGSGSHQNTSGAAVEVENEVGPERDDGRQRRGQDGIDIGISAEHVGESFFYYDSDAQVGAAFLEEPEGRSGQDTIAQRAQPDDGNLRSWRQLVERSVHP
jgi:hypothetical protein